MIQKLLLTIKMMVTHIEFKDEQTNRRARILNIILYSLFLLATIYLIISSIFATFQVARLIALVVLIMITLLSQTLLRIRRVRAAGLLLSISLFILTNLIIFVTDGVNAPISGGYIISFLVAGLTLGNRAGVIFTIMSVMAWLGIYFLQANNLIPPPLIVYNLEMIWALKGFIFIMAAVLLYLATKSISYAFILIQAERDNLEELVAERTKDLEVAYKDLEQKQNDLIHAEQQRVMLESVGAALHHFSQPITAMEASIEIIMNAQKTDDVQKERLFNLYKQSKNDLNNIIQKFQEMRKYRTTPYAAGSKILDIDPSSN